MVLSGEAGIGKSRIAEMVRERVADAGIRIRWQCSPYHADTALHPVIAQLTAAARIEMDDPSATKLEKLERLVVPPESGSEEVAPLLADLLAIPTGDRYPPVTMPPEARRARTLRALAAQLVALSRRRPVLFLVEDAHWIDPTTRELLDSVIEPIARHRVLLLVTGRPEFLNPWGGHSHVTTLALNRLGQRQSTDLVGHVAGRQAGAP